MQIVVPIDKELRIAYENEMQKTSQNREKEGVKHLTPAYEEWEWSPI